MFSWNGLPFARIILPFSIGIFFNLFLPVRPIYIWVGFAIVGVLYLFFIKRFNLSKHYQYHRILGSLIVLLLICGGFIRTEYNDSRKFVTYFKNIDSVSVIKICIDDDVSESDKFYKAFVDVESVYNTQWHNTTGKILVYFNKSFFANKPKVGDKLLIKGQTQTIPEPTNPETFNFKQYLFYQNVHEQFYIKETQFVQLKERKNTLFSHAQSVREQCINQLSRHIKNKDALGVSLALLLGYKEDLNPQTLQSFSQTGTLHVLAVSGLHAGIIFMILNFLSSFLLRYKNTKKLQSILVIVGIWYYAYITGLSPSVCRASLMFTLMALVKLSNRKTNSFNVVFMSAFILILFNPYIILDVGFQLSYAAVLGIIYFQPKLQALYVPRTKLDNYIWGLLTVSFAAQIFTFPLGMYYFHQFPLYFLLSNLVVIPIMLIVLILLISLLALSYFSKIALILVWLIEYLLKINNYALQFIENLPYNLISGIYINKFELVILFIIVFVILGFIEYQKKWQLSVLLFLILFFSSYRLVNDYEKLNQKILTVHQVVNHDVVTCIDGKVMYLISDSVFLDDKKSYKFTIEPYVIKNGIRHIEKCNWDKNYQFAHLKIVKGLGFQFFDTKMTIINRPIQKHIFTDFCLVKSVKKFHQYLPFINHKYLFYSNIKNKYNANYVQKNARVSKSYTNKYLIYHLDKR